MHALRRTMCSRFYGILEQGTIASQGGISAVKAINKATEKCTSQGPTHGCRMTRDWCAARFSREAAVSRGSGLKVINRLVLSRIKRLEVSGGIRAMGVTTRPADRAVVHGVRSPLSHAEGSAGKTEKTSQIDEEVQRGLIADSELPAGRVDKDDSHKNPSTRHDSTESKNPEPDVKQ